MFPLWLVQYPHFFLFGLHSHHNSKYVMVNYSRYHIWFLDCNKKISVVDGHKPLALANSKG